MSELGERIRRTRIEKGMSQEALAEAMGTTKSTISKYELGRRDLNSNNIQRIADALGVSAAQLLGYEKTHEIIPGRLKVIKNEDPNADSISYTIEANDIEAYEYGLGIFSRAGVPIPLLIRLVSAFDSLNEQGQSIAVDRVEELTKIPDYQKENEPPQPE